MVVGEAGDQFPLTVDALQSQFRGGGVDGFATYLTNGGATMTWSTYLGGVGQDSIRRVQFEDSGLAVLGGYSYSADFPIAPATRQTELLGVEDGVLMQLDLLTDLGEGLRVQPVGGESVDIVDAGEVTLLSFDLHNVSDRDLVVDGVRVFVSGAGATAGSVTGLRVLRPSLTESGEEELIGGPVATSLGAETHIALGGAVLPPQSSTRLVVRADLAAPPFGRSYELAAAVVDAAAWDVRAIGAGGGPEVRVGGSGRVTGPTVVLGSLAGDIDGSGTRTVVDLRRMLHVLGSTDAEADVDGDGVLTLVDVDALRDALLGRGTVFTAPAQGARGGFLLLPCLLPIEGGLVQASLGGRTLTVGRAAPRQLSLRVEPDQAVGLHELVVTQGGKVAFAGLVEIF